MKVLKVEVGVNVTTYALDKMLNKTLRRRK